MKKNIRLLMAVAMVSLFAIHAHATRYLVKQDVGQMADMQVVEFKNHQFQKGRTAFASFNDLFAHGVDEWSEIYVAPGWYDGFTVNTPNVTFYGENAFKDAWSGLRNNTEETVIYGAINVNASNVTINGFDITQWGCIRNNTAYRGGSINDVTIVYNEFYDTYYGHDDKTALVYFGDAYRPSVGLSPTDWWANDRYERINISHNTFWGRDADNQPEVVHVAGGWDSVTIVDNLFDWGGTSINLFNCQGTLFVTHNRFYHVGAGQRASGGAVGEFCMRLYYLSCTDWCNAYIRHNYFEDCQGQSGFYPLIRFYNGDTNETIYKPQNCSIYCNFNTFKSKWKARDDGYNYVFYANNGNTTDAHVDWRWNNYDNTEMCFGWIKPWWSTTGAGRYFAGSSIKFNYESSHGTEVGYYGLKDANGAAVYGRVTPTGGAGGLKGWTFGYSSVAAQVCSTVVQSMDIDDATGDCYFIQQSGHGGTYGSSTSKFGKAVDAALPIIRDGSENFLFMTRVAMGGAETHMYLTYGGHGSNMATARVDGTLYILTGGAGTWNSTDPSNVCIFPWVSGAAIDLRQSWSNGVEIRHLWPSAGQMPYPSVDNDNQLMVMRTRDGGGDYFTVYNLRDAVLDPANARPIKQIYVPAGSMKISNSSRQFLNDYDRGFKTWSDQGFTISGDYIYAYEGDGKGGYGSNPTPNDGKSVVIVNVINWRTGEFIQRSAILKSTIINDMCTGSDSGEPESLKIHRDANGRPFMAIGIITGAGGASTPRKFNMFAYKLKQAGGQGDILPIENHEKWPWEWSKEFWTNGGTVSQDFGCGHNFNVKDIHAAIVGDDGRAFSVDYRWGDDNCDSHGWSINFHPDGHKRDYYAKLRLSSPNTPDQFIELHGYYAGDIQTDYIELPPSSVWFSERDCGVSAWAGEEAVKTLWVGGDNLRGGIAIEKYGPGSDRYWVEPDWLAGPGEVRVHYYPQDFSYDWIWLHAVTDGADNWCDVHGDGRLKPERWLDGSCDVTAYVNEQSTAMFGAHARNIFGGIGAYLWQTDDSMDQSQFTVTTTPGALQSRTTVYWDNNRAGWGEVYARIWDVNDPDADPNRDILTGNYGAGCQLIYQDGGVFNHTFDIPNFNPEHRYNIIFTSENGRTWTVETALVNGAVYSCAGHVAERWAGHSLPAIVNYDGQLGVTFHPNHEGIIRTNVAFWTDNIWPNCDITLWGNAIYRPQVIRADRSSHDFGKINQYDNKKEQFYFDGDNLREAIKLEINGEHASEFTLDNTEVWGGNTVGINYVPNSFGDHRANLRAYLSSGEHEVNIPLYGFADIYDGISGTSAGSLNVTVIGRTLNVYGVKAQRIALYNAAGSEMYRVDNVNTADLYTLAPGFYIVAVKDANSGAVKRLKIELK